MLYSLGHLAIQYARKMGYRTVAISSSDAKKQFATELGATDYIASDNPAQELQKMGGADLIVVTAPNPSLVTPLMWALAPKGKVLVLAGEVFFFNPLLPLPTPRLLSLTTLFLFLLQPSAMSRSLAAQ
jgi:D-arabinose 1-dehydrogenase-like Zn-dependent alcohol dehydrogenase